MPRKKLGAGSDNEDNEDASGEGEGTAEPKKGGLTRAKAKLRFQSEDDDSDEEKIPDWKKKREIQAQKLLETKSEEAPSQEQVDEAVKNEDGIASEEAQTGAEEPSSPVNQTEDSSLLRRRKSRNRFDEEHEADTKGLDEIMEGSASKVSAPNVVPWVPPAKRLALERKVFFCVYNDRNEQVSTAARISMRKQGLYVTKDSQVLSGNLERALQRSRVHRAAKDIVVALEKVDAIGGCCCGIVWAFGHIASAHLLLKEAALGHFFHDDDKIFVLPFEPLRDRICRPVRRYDPSLPYMQYNVAVPTTNLDAVLGACPTNTTVELEVSGLTLTDHPLFIEEDYLACELSALHRKHKRRAEANWVNFCTQKLETLQLALENLRKEQTLPPPTARPAGANGRVDGQRTPLSSARGSTFGPKERMEQEQSIQEDIRRVRLQRAQEEMDDLSVISRMIQVWDRLKQVRKEQGFVSTKVDLKFKQRKMVPDDDRRMREEELEAELGEMEQKHKAEADTKLAKLRKEKLNLSKLVEDAQQRVDLLRQLELQAAQTQESEGSSEDDDDGDEDFAAKLRAQAVRRSASTIARAADPLASAQLMRQRVEEEEKLKAAQALLSRHIQLEAASMAAPFDREGARAAILARQELTKRPIGAPVYEPIFREDKLRTEVGALPATPEGAREKKRRERVKALQLIVRIVVNGRLLKRQDGLSPLNVVLTSADGSFQFQASEVVQLVSTSGVPDIELQVLEEGRLASTEIATARVPKSADLQDERGDPISFQGLKPWSSDTTAERDAEQKGVTAAKAANGEQKDKAFVPVKQHFYMGEIFLHFRLPDNIKDQNVGATMTKYGLSGGGIVSAAKLKSMIQLNQIDPNDPRNSHLLEVLNSSKDLEQDALLFDPLQYNMSMGEQIRFNNRYGQVRLESKKKLFGEQILTCPATMRHKLLVARDKGTVFGRPYWPECAIPLLEKEVEEWHWDDFFDKVYPADIPHEEAEEAPLEKRNKEKIVKFQQKVQEQFRKARAKQAGGARRRYKLRDVVHQPEIPELRPFALMDNIRWLFRKRSTLRPEQRQVRVAERMPSHCSVRITVQRAYGLPQRRVGSGGGGRSGAGGAGRGSTEVDASGREGVDGEMLESVVEARFQKHDAVTPVFHGSAPAWNAPLVLPFQPPGNDWTPGKLLKVTDCLHLNVFDTKVWERSDHNGSLRKVEKRWLGSLRVPFTTILNSPCCRIDGLFELDAPPHTVGYTRPAPAGAKAGRRGMAADPPPPADPTAQIGKIQVCIALDPPLQQPGGGPGELKGRGEDRLLDQRICTWISECRAPSHCRGRHFDALARCLKRDWVLVTRYLDKCPPPEDAYDRVLAGGTGADKERAMTQLCRFVSLIPFLEDWHLEDEAGDDDVPSVWCTSREFVVDVGAGDWEEHAALLCNFFLFLERDAYLVFGTGLPEGKTVYVMTLDNGVPTFWNAVRGKRYDARNPLCSLKDVHYIVSPSNVWGNLQPPKALGDMTFRLDDAASWHPLFTPKWRLEALVSAPQHCLSVQTELDWRRSPPRDAEAQRIGKEFRSTIKQVVEHWRSKEGKPTMDNEGVSRRLGEVLSKMERAAHQESTYTEEDLHKDLGDYLNSYHITAFYVNRPYTDIDGLLEEIHYSDIHRCGPVQSELNERDTQFAHAVYVKPFSRRIFSVWVAVACLSKKR